MVFVELRCERGDLEVRGFKGGVEEEVQKWCGVMKDGSDGRC